MNYYEIRVKNTVLNIATDGTCMILVDQTPDHGLPTELLFCPTEIDTWKDSFLPFWLSEPDYELTVTRVMLDEAENWIRVAVTPDEIC